MTEKVVIFGNGQIAEVAQFYLTHDSPYEVVAFTVDGAYIKQAGFAGLPLVAFEEITNAYPPDVYKMFIPVSYRKLNRLRAEKYRQAKDKGYILISYVNSKAMTWPGLVVGDNCFIFENNVIQPFATIGNNVIIWSGNHIGHHSTIKDHCFIASHVVISGGVTIEPYCFLGVNSTIRDNVTISTGCIIGAGALITKTTKEKGVYSGVPAEARPFDSDEFLKLKDI
ncbi:MAG: acetyltransferase [Candidatus Lindowbacteria bacterium]|nr:acetyltransferase [Candidatus Lindowbacteria bacterium]